MRQTIYLIIHAFIIFLVTSCAAVPWQMKIENPKMINLVWPPEPNPVKVSYLGEIQGFTQTEESLLVTLFGKSDAGKILKPVAMAVGDDGRVAVVDSGRKGVHLFLPSAKKYQLIKQAGDDEFVSPVSVIFDATLRVMISDSQLNKVFLYDQNGVFLREITSSSVTFSRPTGVCFHSQEKSFYIVDTIASKIHNFDEAGRYLGFLGMRGSGKGEFNLPTHIAAGPNGRIFVNDAMNFRAQIIAPPDNFVASFGRHGNGSGDFAMPKGIAVDRWGVIYIAETLFDRVQLFNDRGEYLMSIGAKGTGHGEFWMPSGLFIDRHDRLYVCDTYNGRIQVFQLHSRQGGE